MRARFGNFCDEVCLLSPALRSGDLLQRTQPSDDCGGMAEPKKGDEKKVIPSSGSYFLHHGLHNSTSPLNCLSLLDTGKCP